MGDDVTVTLIVDSASSARPLSDEALRAWARGRSVFVSSEMRELADHRRAVADALRDLGMRVVMFEDLGGRDEDAERAYLAGVAESDIYLGLVGDRYGTMLASGRSPTHEEYATARALGRRISVWARADGSNRQGNARDFLDEVRVFHTTGQFASPDDLAHRVVARIAEIAAEEDSPWVKAGDAVLRVDRVRDEGSRVELHASVRDDRIARYLEDLRADNWGRARTVVLTTSERSGQLTVDAVVSEASARSHREIVVSGSVTWADGRGGAMDAGTSGFSADDLTEVGVRVGLLGEAMPDRLSGTLEFLVDASDPLEPLVGQALGEATIGAVGRLLVVERLIGTGRAGSIGAFEIGPAHAGRRRLRLTYTDPQRYSNVEPGSREIEGARAWI